MTTYGEVFDSVRPLVSMFTVADFDAPPLVEVKVDLTPADGATALPVGDPGPQGDPGEPGPSFRFMGYVTSDDAIPDDSILGPYDEGKAWANTTTGSIWLWDGDSFMEIPDGLGVPGPPGPAADISLGTVSTSPPNGVASITAVGSPLARRIDVVLPRGPKGPDGDVGPSGPIRQAVDYSNVTAPKNGDMLEYDELLGKFKPVSPKRMVGPFTLIDSDFSKATFNAASAVVATVPIPAQSFKYRFSVTGVMMINAADGTSSSVAPLFIGQVVPQSTTTAIARGYRDVAGGAPGVRACPMLPYSGGVKLTPASTVNEMPADTAQVLNVQILREGSGAYNVVSDVINNIEVWLIPT